MDNIFFDLKDLKYCGENVIIGKTVRIRKPHLVSIGDGTIIDDFTYISTEMTLGKHCHIGPNVTISGGVNRLATGDYVGISAGCSIHVASSDYTKASLDLPSIPEERRFGGVSESIFFDNFVLLGAQTVVLPGVSLPEGVATGAHTVLSKRKYEPWYLYLGKDGKKSVRRRHERIDKMLDSIDI